MILRGKKFKPSPNSLIFLRHTHHIAILLHIPTQMLIVIVLNFSLKFPGELLKNMYAGVILRSSNLVDLEWGLHMTLSYIVSYIPSPHGSF